jgi:hypothetical protein
MEVHEKMQGWKEEEFDVVLQYMRTILLRRKASRQPSLKPDPLTHYLRWRLVDLHDTKPRFTASESRPLKFGHNVFAEAAASEA